MERFNTQPPEGGWKGVWRLDDRQLVSTHSRPKDGGFQTDRNRDNKVLCFNTQPPEGGWVPGYSKINWSQGFNTQPPEGGWDL